MVCPSCGIENPKDNRFCGNCGVRLNVPSAKEPEQEEPRAEAAQRTPTLLGLDLPVRESHYPREGYDAESETPPVSSLHEQLPPELIEYDKRIPLIAEPGMDRRKSKEPAFERDIAARDEASERTRDRVDEQLRRPETVRSAAPRPTSPGPSVLTTSSILGLSAPTADEFGATETVSTPAEAERETAPVPTHSSAESTRGHFLDFSEPVGRDESLHGPSFLGLSSSPEEYEEEEGTGSHARRNFALFVLLLLAILIALQWRSIRDFGVRYAQNGGIHIPGMKAAKNDSNAPNANANNSTAVNGGSANESSSTSGATNGAAANSGQGPDILVAPTQNPAANNNANSGQQANSTGQSAPNSGDNAANQHANTAGDQNTQPGGTNSDGASATTAGAAGSANSNAKGDSKSSEISSSKKSSDDADAMPQGEPNEDSGDVADEKPTAPSKKARARQPADDALQYGAAELSQANATSDPASKAQLLWKSTSKGNPIAPVQLAELYLAGQGVPQDCEQALVLLRSAAAKRNPRARSKLGSLYATGQCVEQDRVQAYHWMSLALQVNPGSEWVERNRQSLWAQMTADERRRAGRDR